MSTYNLVNKYESQVINLSAVTHCIVITVTFYLLFYFGGRALCSPNMERIQK